MRFDINLASAPYQDVRQFLRRWGTATAALAFVTLVLVVAALANWWGARAVSREMAQKQDEMRQLDADKAKAEELFTHPGNREVLERSRFLNSLIARKAFSWTQLFMDLEQIMPPRVRVVSLQPEAGEDRVTLKLLVEGDSRERALDLVRRMEESRRFRQPRVKSERGKEEGGGVELEIVAFYVPQNPRGTP